MTSVQNTDIKLQGEIDAMQSAYKKSKTNT